MHKQRLSFNAPRTAPYARYYLDTFRSAASAVAVEPIEAAVHSAADIESLMGDLGREAGSGLIIMPDTAMQVHRRLIYSLAARYRLPVIYPFRFFVSDGGLMSYGIVLADLLRGAATYTDCIFRGAKPSELPVQLPTKFELILNINTAKALGFTFPPTLIVRADEVID
jgi:putative ABC transport system substrate-binding protein